MIEQIKDKISLIEGKNKGRFPYAHSILIEDKKGHIIIDTGSSLGILKKIKSKYNITRVINSHTHPDHSSGNWLFNNGNSSIHVPQEGFNTSGNIYALSERLAEPGELATYWRSFASQTMGFKDCSPTHSFDSRTTFEFGDVTLEALHTPGHTADHYCFYEPDKGILFAFDIDLTSFGPWYGHRESSIPDFKKSIEKIEQLDIKLLVSGHKGIITNDIANQLEKFSKKFDERDQIIIDLLQDGGQTVEQLVNKAPIYGQFPYAEPLLRYWEGQMILKHLEELEKRDRVVREQDNTFTIRRK